MVYNCLIVLVIYLLCRCDRVGKTAPERKALSEVEEGLQERTILGGTELDVERIYE